MPYFSFQATNDDDQCSGCPLCQPVEYGVAPFHYELQIAGPDANLFTVADREALSEVANDIVGPFRLGTWELLAAAHIDAECGKDTSIANDYRIVDLMLNNAAERRHPGARVKAAILPVRRLKWQG